MTTFDQQSAQEPLTLDIRLRYTWWGEDRLVIINPLQPKNVLYKVICQPKDYCRILGWTIDRTNVTTLTSINTISWYLYSTRDDPNFYDQQKHNETGDRIKRQRLLKQSLLISTDLYDNIFNVTFYPREKKYTIAHSRGQILAEISHFDPCIRQTDRHDDYSLDILEDIIPKVDPAFLISISIMIDYIDWSYFLPGI
ncbi:hypothetical protein I4U23_027037 [Adineta vaga]|nr:hypothetical protein I4U23_027037 [Adineta vaga]